MDSSRLAKYRNLVLEASSSIDAAKIMDNIAEQIVDGLYYELVVHDHPAPGIHVVSITIEVRLEKTGLVYRDGDIGVYYEAHGAHEEMEEAMRYFMSGKYDNDLQQHLVNAGFTPRAASEAVIAPVNMQDQGRASYYGKDIANEVREAFHTTKLGSDEAKIEYINDNGFDSFLIDDVNWPAHVLDTCKRTIIAGIIKYIKRKGFVDNNVRKVLGTLEDFGANWPELGALKKVV